MRIALGQINPTVGDLAGNTALCARFARDAAERGAELIVFPELALTGYPPRDLVEKRGFIERSEAAVLRLAEDRRAADHRDRGLCRPLEDIDRQAATNSAAILRGGAVLMRQTKMLLPTYDVFDDVAQLRARRSADALAIRRRKRRAHDLRGCLER